MWQLIICLLEYVESLREDFRKVPDDGDEMHHLVFIRTRVVALRSSSVSALSSPTAPKHSHRTIEWNPIKIDIAGIVPIKSKSESAA